MANKEKTNNEFALDQLYESAHNIKFMVTSLDEYFIVLTELTPKGVKTYKKKKYTRDIFAGLVANKSFALTRIARREVWADLYELELNKFANK